MFARHLKLYGHSRHGTVGRLKHRIPKLKWRTSGNFHDCGVFTMLHMESFNGETAAKWDCGIFINVHSKKILELANEFDKVDSLEGMAIIVEAVKNREERDRFDIEKIPPITSPVFLEGGFGTSAFTSSMSIFNFSTKAPIFPSSLLNKNKQSSTKKFASF
ncbi:hypothetical protein Tco_1099844, partial [Tanacetum coccineum]